MTVKLEKDTLLKQEHELTQKFQSYRNRVGIEIRLELWNLLQGDDTELTLYILYLHLLHDIQLQLATVRLLESGSFSFLQMVRWCE